MIPIYHPLITTDPFRSTHLAAPPQTPLILWTAAEDEKLVKLVSQGNSLEEAAQQIPGRSVEDCQMRWGCLLYGTSNQNSSTSEPLSTDDSIREQTNKTKHTNTRCWTLEDKQLLPQLVKKHTQRGRINWVKIAKHFPNKTNENCRDCWRKVVKKKLPKQELIEEGSTSERASQIASQAFSIPPHEALNLPANMNYPYQAASLPTAYSGHPLFAFTPNMGYPYQAFPLPITYSVNSSSLPAATTSYSDSAPPSKEATVLEVTEKRQEISPSEEELTKCLLFLKRKLGEENGVGELVKSFLSLKRKPVDENNRSERVNKVARTGLSASPQQAFNQQTLPAAANVAPSLEKMKIDFLKG